MNTRPENVTTEQAEAQRAVVRSTVRIVGRAIVVMLAATAAAHLALAGMIFEEGIPHEVFEAVLITLIALPLLYAMTVRPMAKLVARQAAASAEARFQTIAQAAGDAILILDVDWKTYFANRAAEKMFGVRTREWKEATIEAFLPEGTKQFLQASRQRYRETGESALSKMEAFELDLLRRDGSRFPAELRVSELREDQQTLFVAILRDITERKQAEEALLTEKELIESLIQSLPGVFCLFDSTGKLLRWNRHFETVSEYSPEEIGQMSALDYIAEENRPLFAQSMQEALEKGATQAEGQLLSKSGKKAAYLFTGIRVMVDNKPCVVGVGLDITARKQAEEALRESEDRYRDLVEHSEDLICTHDLGGRILSSNPWAARVLGYAPDTILKMNIRDLLAPQTRAEYDVYLAEILERGTAKGTLLVQTATGEERIWEYNNTLRTEGVAAPIVRGMAHDITERKQAEQALRQLSGHLLHVQDEERRRLARELHDTTAQNLAGLAMNLGVVKESGTALNPTAHKALSDSLDLAEQCSREIRTVSYLLHPPLLDDLGLASAVKWYAEGFAQRSGIHVEVDVSPELGRLTHNVELTLFRVVQESLTNIHRHSGSPTAQIRIVRNPTEVILEVKDQGRGMLPDTLERVSACGGALGVGIAGMLERVRQLGGRLEIDSCSQGTTVRAIQPVIGSDS